jgi:hypothetical protein
MISSPPGCSTRRPAAISSLHGLERNVLDHVEGRDQRQAVVGACAQRPDCVGRLDVQAALAAGGQHAVVEVDAFAPRSHDSPAVRAIRRGRTRGRAAAGAFESSRQWAVMNGR